MVNRVLKDPFRIMDEIDTLIDRAMLQIVNVMRHKDLQTADKNTVRQVDQLTRALEYLCDVEEYNRKIEKKIRGMLKTGQWQKKRIKELDKNTTFLEGLGLEEMFTVSPRLRSDEE